MGRRVPVLCLLFLLLIPSAGISAAQTSSTSDTNGPVAITLTTLEETNPGHSWKDESGDHVRDQVLRHEVSGDISGTASVAISGDTVDGSETIWMTGTIEADDGPWSLRAILTAGQDGDLLLHSGVLIGAAENASRTVVFDRVLESRDDSLTLSGTAHLRGMPTTSLSVLFDVCINSPQSVMGAFHGTITDVTGDFSVDSRDADSGAMEAMFLMAGPVENGLVMGDGELRGKHGTLNFLLTVDRYGQHGIGKAVFMGGSGAYAGIFGTTKMLLTDVPNSDCPIGIGAQGQFLGSTSPQGGPPSARVRVLSKGSDIYGANGMYFGPDGYLYVASVVGREIVVYDPNSGQIVERLGPDQGVESPDDVTFGPDGSLYWTQFFTGEVGRMAPDGTVTHQFVAPGVNPITISEDGRLVVGLAFIGEALYELDPELTAEPRLIGEEYHLNGFDFGPDGKLYGPQLSTSSIVRIDIDTGELETVSTEVVGPAAAKFNSQGELHATEFAGGRVLKVDIDTGAVEVLAELPTGGDNLAFDVDDRLFVSHAIDTFVAEILPSGNLRYVERPGIRSVGALAILTDGDTERLFEADGFAVREIDLRSGRELDADRTALVLPGGVSDALTVAPDGDDLLLTSWFTNQVQVWDPDADMVVESHLDFNVPLNAIRFQGDLIVTEAGTSSVVRADGANPSVRETLMAGLALPTGLAASDDDLWVADWVTGGVWQIVADGVVLTDPQLVADGLVSPEGMTLDQDGSLLVVESGIGQVTRIDPATGATSIVAEGLETGLEAMPGAVPTWFFAGIAVDTQGTIYVGGDAGNVIYRIDRPGS